MWYEAVLIAIGFLAGWVVLERPHWICEHIVKPVKRAWFRHVYIPVKNWLASHWPWNDS